RVCLDLNGFVQTRAARPGPRAAIPATYLVGAPPIASSALRLRSCTRWKRARERAIFFAEGGYRRRAHGELGVARRTAPTIDAGGKKTPVNPRIGFPFRIVAAHSSTLIAPTATISPIADPGPVASNGATPRTIRPPRSAATTTASSEL